MPKSWILNFQYRTGLIAELFYSFRDRSSLWTVSKMLVITEVFFKQSLISWNQKDLYVLLIVDHTYSIMTNMISASSLFLSVSVRFLSYSILIRTYRPHPPPPLSLTLLFPYLSHSAYPCSYFVLSLLISKSDPALPSLYTQYDSAFSCIFIFALLPPRPLSICPALNIWLRY
jgi:hypothetical protein